MPDKIKVVRDLKLILEKIDNLSTIELGYLEFKLIEFFNFLGLQKTYQETTGSQINKPLYFLGLDYLYKEVGSDD